MFFPISCFAQKEHEREDNEPDTLIYPIFYRTWAVMLSASAFDGGLVKLGFPILAFNNKRHGLMGGYKLLLAENGEDQHGFLVGYTLIPQHAAKKLDVFLEYNFSYFFNKQASTLTHIAGIGVQIDIGKYFFIRHSVGLGFYQTTNNLDNTQGTAQLRLALGYYLKTITR